jgi:putative FmdB family regulatory protein
MPTYEYECQTCARRFDQLQRFADDPLTTDSECGGPVRRVIQPVGIIFKGSGFYVTDSRKASSASSNGNSADKTESKTADTKASEGSSSKDSSSSKDGSSSKESSSSSKESSKESSSSKESKPAPAAAKTA